MPIRVLTGPTGSGKSAIAMSFARRAGAAIINADSQQVYRELQILTARPSAEDERTCRHELYGCISIRDTCSAGQWAHMAEQSISGRLEAGQPPLLVGGSGLYIEALVRGFVDLPNISSTACEAAKRDFETAGQDEAIRTLQTHYGTEPVPTDPARLARAWQVWHSTGTPLPVWQQTHHRRPNPNWKFRIVILLPDRDWLYKRIDSRVDGMLEAGALDEAQALAKLQASRHPLPGLKAHGLPALHAHLAGEIGLEEAKSIWRRDTRRYAKRQMTWARGKWLNAPASDVGGPQISVQVAATHSEAEAALEL